MQQHRGWRVIRGLALGLSLSFVNLLGVLLTLTALGGLGEWENAQFVGLFGTFEVATGLAFIIGPNIWRLPVAQAKLSHEEVRFAASTILIPHWAGGVKCIAGLAFIAYAASREGVGPATAGLPVLVLLVCAASVGLSMLLARLGTSRPDLDVYGLAIRRVGRPEIALPELSLCAAFVQLLLNVMTFPTVSVMPPDALYQPEIGPSAALLGWGLAGGGALLLAGFAAWAGRLDWQAPRPQQREAEQFVSGQ
jgi:hypothetical protein